MKRLFIVCLLCLTGCRTVKTSQKATEDMKRNAELTTVTMKTGTKESNIWTYWPDGRVYQFEQAWEQMDETRLAELEIEEKRTAMQQMTKKERVPAKFWVYIGIGLALVCSIWMCRIIK